jgi:acetoin utilization deacetylase AcuC-like enzyme/formylglycine-generating enzyme required for sulfatase activity
MRTPRARPAAFHARLLMILAALAGPSCQKADQEAAAPGGAPVVRSKSGIDMVLVPAGWFLMGSDRGKADESPAHRVWIDAFLMDVHEVTQGAYGHLVLGNPSHFKGPRRPMEQISWPKAALYCNARSRAEGLRPCYDEATAECNFEADGYRLPTEAEWEYACRAGADADYFFGADAGSLGNYAWYAEDSARMTHPVCERKPNPWGLFDMYGNVAEWCNDLYGQDYYKASPERDPRGPAAGAKYVLRGGAWNSSAGACRSSYRAYENPGFQDACFALDAIGFRCVRSAAKSPAPEASAGDDPPAAAARPPTGIVYGDIYLKHLTGSGHAERPERLQAVMRRLRERGLLADLTLIAPAAAPKQWITEVHSPEHLEQVRKACLSDAGRASGVDTAVSAESYDVAVAAVGGVLAAVDAVMDGRVRNAFCAVRPPGHHATKDRSAGFCIFNNVAIAARYVQKKHGLARVLIVDWDVHRGNGTQDLLAGEENVLVFDVHRRGIYPDGGEERQPATGAGRIINVNLAAGAGDAQYKAAFEERLAPAAAAFRPDFVLVSAGFDAAKGDPLGGMTVTPAGYAALTRITKGIAEASCRGRLVSVLEGGYDPDTLADSVEAHVRALME